MTDELNGNDITIGECSLINIPEHCEYYFKLDESDYKFQCVKFKGHTGKHYVIGRDV